MLILSAGYLYNLESKNYSEVEGLIKDKLVESIEFDFINDLFFNIKKGSESQFLTYDASCIYLEVDKNAIFKI